MEFVENVTVFVDSTDTPHDGRHQAGPVMSPTQERLTFLDDNTLLIISSLGLACVVLVVLWVARTLDWRRTVGLDRENDGDPALLGPRTRVIPGGREAAKAARKEAKKRAKAEFKRSHQSSSNQQRRNHLLIESQKNRRVRDGLSTAGKDGHEKEKEAHDRSIDVLRKLEDYLLNHKVSPSRHLADELGVAPAEIVQRITELEKEGKCSWIVVEDTHGESSFVRIRADEMRAIASFVNEKGRLTVEELAAEANKVLQLAGVPKADFNPEEKQDAHIQSEEEDAKGEVEDENAKEVLDAP